MNFTHWMISNIHIQFVSFFLHSMALYIFTNKGGYRRRKKVVNAERETGKERNRPPKGNMGSAIPIALLCMVVKWNERKQGSRPKGDKVL